MNDKIVVIGGLRDSFVAALARQHEIVPIDGPAAGEARIAVTGAAVGIGAEQLARLPRLALVASFGVGYERINVAAALARGIVVTNTPGCTDICVADQAMALYLAVARRTVEGDRFVREGRWTPSEKLGFAHRASRRKLGILGLGRIGMQIAKRAAAFEMPIAYHNRGQRPDVDHHYCASVLELAQWADVLAVACPGGAGTRNLVDRRVLEALGPQGVVVNIARGSIIDEAALLAALKDGTIAGAGLDVFADEPRMSPEFWKLPNVVLAPHLGGVTAETWNDCEGVVVDNIRAFLAGKPVPTPIPECAPQGAQA